MLDITTSLGGTVYPAGAALVYSQGAYSSLFDPVAAGVPSGVRADAISLSALGLVLSFDTTMNLPGNGVVADEDLVEWDGANFTQVLDGSALGLDGAFDVDAAQDLGGGQFLFSLDTSGSIGGVFF